MNVKINILGLRKKCILMSILFLFSQCSFAQSKFVGGYETSSGGQDLWVILENSGVQVLFLLDSELSWEALVGNYDSRTNTTVFDSAIGLPPGGKIEVTAYWNKDDDNISAQLRVTRCTIYNVTCPNYRSGTLLAYISKIFDS